MARLLFTLALILAPFAAAQSLSDCALACSTKYLSSSPCTFNDQQCLCTNTEFLSTVACCIDQNCTVEEQQGAAEFSQSQCSSYDAPPASCTDSPTKTSSSNTVFSSPTASPTGTGDGAHMRIPSVAAFGVAAAAIGFL